MCGARFTNFVMKLLSGSTQKPIAVISLPPCFSVSEFEWSFYPIAWCNLMITRCKLMITFRKLMIAFRKLMKSATLQNTHSYGFLYPTYSNVHYSMFI
jgi:hypothetical protein